MSEIVQGWNVTDPSEPYQVPVSAVRYFVDVSDVQNTNGPVVWRQAGLGATAELSAWFRNERRWVRKKQGPDAVWHRVSVAEAEWIIAARGEHVAASNEREPKETET